MSETSEAAEKKDLYSDLPPGFYYLMQRIDTLEINLRNEFNSKIDKIDSKIESIRTWSITTMITIILGFGALIFSLVTR